MTLGSLFSGIGGIDLAFERTGFSVAWQVEIDRQASSVLARHWPNAPRFEDVRKVGKRNLPRVDVIAGGFPCQSLSVAGKRAGLADLNKSGLWFQMLRVTNELKPSFLLFENVPGLLSSNGGRDFAVIIRGLADIGYSGAWRTLDAQFFGVSQRRRRVFGVFARGRFAAERCAKILSLANGLPGNSQASGEAGKDIAARLGGRSSSSGVSAPGRGGEDDCNLVLAPALRASGVGTERAGDTRGQDPLVIAHTLRGDGFDASEDGTESGGVPFLVAPQLSMCLNAKSGKRDDGESETFIAHTLRGDGFDASEDGTGRGTPLVAFAQNTRDEVRNLNGIAGALAAQPGMKQQTYMAGLSGVRRLTPLECERLQGLPDGWTEFDADGKQMADGPRYRMIGNGVAVPVLEWIASRLMIELRKLKAVKGATNDA